jgi:hypothetical protein
MVDLAFGVPRTVVETKHVKRLNIATIEIRMKSVEINAIGVFGCTI